MRLFNPCSHGLPGLLGDLELDRPMGFLLEDDRA
jgi:hypothetical protein